MDRISKEERRDLIWLIARRKRQAIGNLVWKFYDLAVFGTCLPHSGDISEQFHEVEREIPREMKRDPRIRRLMRALDNVWQQGVTRSTKTRLDRAFLELVEDLDGFDFVRNLDKKEA